MTTTHRHAAPWTLRRFMAVLFLKPQPRRRSPRPGVTHILTGREAAARHLFGESVQWSTLDMLSYDNDALLRGGWLAEADRRIAGQPIAIHDLLVLRHWGYTPAEWVQLPAIVKVDKREGYAQAMGLAS